MTSGKIRLFHDSRHLCTRFKIDGLKAMSRGILGANKRKKFASRSNFAVKSFRSQVVRVSTSFMSLLLTVRTSKAATASKKVAMITSTHNLPLSS